MTRPSGCEPRCTCPHPDAYGLLRPCTQEKFINDREVLLAAVGKAGLDVEGAKQVLDGGRPDVDAEVKQQLGAARREGISGVPNFTITGGASNK